MRLIIKVALTLGLILVVAGCGGGSGDRTPTPSAPTSGPTVGSVPGFEEFAGLTIPGSASDVDVRATVDSEGQPSYRVEFTLPSDELDAFCRSGQLNRPLRVVTIPADFRDTFGYTGDSSTGVAIAEGSRPSDVSIQRKVLAVGTKTSKATVSVYAYRMPR